MTLRILTFALVGIFVYATVSHAAMTSTNYQIRWDSVSTGGSDTSSSASYLLRDSVDQSAGARSSSTTYRVDSGYRGGIFDQIITFDLFIEDRESKTAATGYAANVITADPTDVSTNDYIALVQDLGANQVVGIGKVSSTGAGTITLDSLTVGSATPSIDGTNDFYFVMDAAALSLGELSDQVVTTGVIGFEVTTVNENGYVVQVLDNGDITTGGETLTDVADGTVTAGSEEYGAISSDTSIAGTTFDTEDTALTTSGQAIATTSTAAYDERNFLSFKAAITDVTEQGDYSHVVTFIASGNF